MVFDLVGGDTQTRSFPVLKRGGYLVSAIQPVSQEEAARHGVTGTMMRLEPSDEETHLAIQLVIPPLVRYSFEHTKTKKGTSTEQSSTHGTSRFATCGSP